MKSKDDNIRTQAFILAKKDKTHAIRQVLIVGDKIPFCYISAFGASNSASISALTSPFALVHIDLKQQKAGKTLVDGYIIQHYPQINENLDYFNLIYEWVNLIIKTSGAGEDERLYPLLQKVFQGIEACIPCAILNVIFYAEFMYIMGIFPENELKINLENFLNKTPPMLLEDEMNWSEIYLTLKKTLQNHLWPQKNNKITRENGHDHLFKP